VPLLLSFKNKDPTDDEPIQIIFKAGNSFSCNFNKTLQHYDSIGDDLRQDIITLQMMVCVEQTISHVIWISSLRA